jgi:hypothetical protein
MKWPLLPLTLCVISLGTRAQQPIAPELDTKPLPPIAQLLDDVEKHEDRDDKLLQQYTYHRHVVQEEYGGSKKTTTSDYESIPIAGVRVSKLVARDGKPLSADEAKKVDEDFDRSVEKAKKNKTRFDSKREQAEREGKSNNEFLPASRILQLGTFSNERRILFNGRPTIVLDYTGNKDVKSKDEMEKVVQDLVGTAWIDEQDKVLARAEGHFLADFKIGLGLIADIHKDFNFTMEQRKINGEAWLPREFDFYGKASVGIFLARVNGHTHVESSDYRKFRATSTIIGTNGAITENGNPVPDPDAEPGSPAKPPPQPSPKP